MNATTLLKADHATVKKLFRAYEKAQKAEDNAQKKSIFDEIATELDVHAQLEEEVFYPAMKGTDEEEAVEGVLEAAEEHAIVKTLLAQLRKMRPEDEAYDAKVTVLIESVEHHVKEEEEEMFPRAKEELGLPMLRELGARIEARKAELLGNAAAPRSKRAA